LILLGVYISPAMLRACVLLQLVAAEPACHDEFGCSLAGECVDGACVCDGWTHGSHCEVLNLLPVDSDKVGYRNTSGYTSWGGGPIEVDGKWHLFVSQIQGKCPLAHYWSSASEAAHLVADDPMGPFEEAEIVIPALAHNVKPFQAPDGKFLIYYVGPTTGAVADCSTYAANNTPIPKGASGPVMIASADSPFATASQWEHHGPMTDSFEWHSATNPSPVFLPNGSVLLFVSRRWTFDDGHNQKNNWIMMADSWEGPYRNITQRYEDALETGEDPHVFKTERGFHMLNHNTGAASTVISFSKDGLNWVSGKELKKQGWENAFNGTLHWSNGSISNLCRRQRPYIVAGEDGMPGWLWNGVMDGPTTEGGECLGDSTWPTWTLVQAIGRPQSLFV